CEGSSLSEWVDRYEVTTLRTSRPRIQLLKSSLYSLVVVWLEQAANGSDPFGPSGYRICTLVILPERTLPGKAAKPLSVQFDGRVSIGVADRSPSNHDVVRELL